MALVYKAECVCVRTVPAYFLPFLRLLFRDGGVGDVGFGAALPGEVVSLALSDLAFFRIE